MLPQSTCDLADLNEDALQDALQDARQVHDYLRGNTSQRNAARALLEARRPDQPGVPGPTEYMPRSREEAIAMVNAHAQGTALDLVPVSARRDRCVARQKKVKYLCHEKSF